MWKNTLVDSYNEYSYLQIATRTDLELVAFEA